jgi:UDP-glucose 4-epimerase
LDAAWDISQQDGPDPICEPAVVVHSAARLGSYQQPIADATELFAVNVGGTVRVAQWCASKQVQQLILISGAIVYGEWTGSPRDESELATPWISGPYAVSKYCSEQAASLVQEAGISLTVLRLSSLYGAGYTSGLVQRLLKQGRESGTIQLRPPLDDSFDLLNVEDAARTVALAVENGTGGLWNVGGGKLTTIKEVAELCSNQAGAEVSFSNETANRPPRIINWVNDEKARSELGHTNQITVDAGIAAIASSIAKEAAEYRS